jgi:nucleotide-binding universal stress UspA family protein
MPVIENPIGLELDNIILATDFTSGSLVAEQYAEALAGRFCAKVTVANVVDLSVATRSPSAVVGLPIEEMKHKAVEGVGKLVDSLRDAGIRSEGTTLSSYNVGSAIVDLSQQSDANLIVMGTKATRGLSKMIVGSVAEGVIHHAKCPVITVGPRVRKLNAPVLSIENIVFATDLKHDVAMKAAVVLTFAKDSVSHIHICHVLDHSGDKFGDTLELQLNAEAALRKLIPKPTYEWCSPRYIVEAGEVGQHVLQLAKRVHADLIVLGAHRDATWFTHLSEGVIETVLAHAECPVMTICTN